MNRTLFFWLITLVVTWVACSVAPEPIAYGADQCQFCRMTIVDQQHAAQYVTSKGKQFKFDAIECMLNALSENDVQPAQMRVALFEKPGVMHPAEEAHYLISEGIPSPMGAFLTAFGSMEECAAKQASLGGEVLDWNTLRSKTFK